ncbi:MAG: T9SS type A sorting domain-containing protein [Bacteroidia bacterium]|nr:T9SS type A sorting domain-containing protein [Bacteroidia bacterium]
MKTKIHLIAAGIALYAAACISNVNAQAYKLNQVIVLNDGNRLYNDTTGTYTTVGSYNPATKIYKDFDTIKGSKFGSYVIIDSGYIYVGADSLLIKYDLNTKQRVAKQTVIGIREMAVWGNRILVTLGTTFPLHSYFQVFNKSNLQLIYQDTTVSHATQGIKVMNDSAYIAINDFGSGSVGLLGVEDLKAQKEKREVNLGVNGLNPYDVEIEPTNKRVFTINDLNWTNSTVTKYNAATVAFVNYSLNLSSGCTGSAYYQGNVYFQAGNDANIGLFSTSSNTVWDSLKINKFIYGMAIDSADGYMYVSQTDYKTFGETYIYNLFGQAIDSFATDVAPGNFAFDITSVAGVPQINTNIGLSVYPNPASNQVLLNFSGACKGMATLVITNLPGQEVYSNQISTAAPYSLSLGNLASGMYFITLETTNGKVVKKIIKQ